jgi:beta-lactamase regulating signal transducer with metallopeptidase domain
VTDLLLQWLVEGTAIACVATLASRVVPATCPAHRHTFWWGALAAMIVVPLALMLVAQMTVTQIGEPSAVVTALVPAFTIPAPPEAALFALAVLWAAWTLACSARLILDVRSVLRLSAASLPLEENQVARFTTFESVRHSSRFVTVAVSPDIRGACAVGFFRPRIIVSSALVDELEPEALESIVMHEYAHLQRCDDWTRLIQRIVLACAGLHPAVRWASRQIDIEREAACDRKVVDCTGAPAAYARSLTRAAEIVARSGGLTPAIAPGASTDSGSLHARVVRLLAREIVSRRHGLARAAASAAMLMIGVATVHRMPPLVVFASIAEPLEALASVPLSIGRLAQLPIRIGPQSESETPSRSAGPRLQTVVPASRDLGESRDVTLEPVTRETVTKASENTHETQTLLASIPAASALIDAPRADANSLAPGDQRATPESSNLVVSFGNPAGNAGSAIGSTAAGAGAAIGDTAASLSTSIGKAASNAGAGTGEAAARAGRSIGRFFRNGGAAIAKSF